MSKTNKPASFLDWIGINSVPDYDKAPKTGRVIGVFLQALALLIFLVALALLTAFGLAVYKAIAAGTEIEGAAIRNVGLALAAVFGAPFLVWRSVVAQKQADIAEQSQITERINKAVENLGASRSIKRQRRLSSGELAHLLDDNGEPDLSQPLYEDITEPNIEVRIGAIYALERIAQDSLRDHVQIMEILTAYIRENAPASLAEDFPEPEWDVMPDDLNPEDRKAREAARMERFGRNPSESKVWPWARNLTCPTDIQAALTVIGRREATQKNREKDDTRLEPTGYRLDLRQTCLQGADLSNTDLANADFKAARLEGAILTKAHLERANLFGTHLEGASGHGAHLEGAHLFSAHLEGAALLGAHLERAHLVGAHLEGADLDHAHLEGASLVEAHLEGANLGRAHLEKADLHGAHLEGATLVVTHLEGASLIRAHLEGANLSEAHLEGADLGGTHLDQSTAFHAAHTSLAALRSVDLTGIRLTGDQINAMFGDASVILPATIPRPSHWPNDSLSARRFIYEWVGYESDPGAYRPPQHPDRQ